MTIAITTNAGCRCAVIGCKTNGLAYHKLGGMYFCRKHFNAMRAKREAAIQEINQSRGTKREIGND